MNILKSINLFRYLKISFLIAIISFAASCTKTEDEDAIIDDREKFIGTWNCNETSAIFLNTPNITVKISYHTNSSQVYLNNFYQTGYDINIYAIIAGNSITIPKQLICEDKYIESGNGTLNNKEINIAYKIKIVNTNQIDNCTAIFTKIQ